MAHSVSAGNGSGHRNGCTRRALHVLAVRRHLLGAPERPDFSPDRHPLGHLSEHVVHPLGGEIGLRRGEIENEFRPTGSAFRVQRWLRRSCDVTYPWISQPSAARAASMIASDSVGWPWMMRATSG